MRILIALMISALVSCVAIDKGVVVSGTIKDSNGRSLKGVGMQISGRNVYTNDEGYFCYEGLHPDKDITIFAEMDSYKSVSKTLKHSNYELKIVMARLDEAADGEISIKVLPKEVAYDWYCGVATGL